MAAISTHHVDTPARIGPYDLAAGTIYYTAQGKLAYAVTRTLIMLVDDPSADVLTIGGKDRVHADRYGSARFPFTRAPEGTSICISQEMANKVPLVRVSDLVDAI